MRYCLPVLALALTIMVAIPPLSGTADACTGVTLKAGDRFKVRIALLP